MCVCLCVCVCVCVIFYYVSVSADLYSQEKSAVCGKARMLGEFGEKVGEIFLIVRDNGMCH